MQTTRIKRTVNPSSSIHLMIHSVVFLILFSMVLIFEVSKQYWGYALGIGVITLLTNLTFRITQYRNRLYKKVYSIECFDCKVDIPSSFIKKFRMIMPNGRRAYYVNHQIIPRIFVEFIEGNRAYVVKTANEAICCETYKLIYLHQKKIALIEDSNKRRFLVHFDNLKIVVN